jgi:hypothetical protein
MPGGPPLIESCARFFRTRLADDVHGPLSPPLHLNLKNDFDPGLLLTVARMMLLPRIRGERAAAQIFERFVDGDSWERLPADTREPLRGQPEVATRLVAGWGRRRSSGSLCRITATRARHALEFPTVRSPVPAATSATRAEGFPIIA